MSDESFIKIIRKRLDEFVLRHGRAPSLIELAEAINVGPTRLRSLMRPLVEKLLFGDDPKKHSLWKALIREVISGPDREREHLTSEEYAAMWVQCYQCRELLYRNHLRENHSVCPKCKYHFRIGAKERIEQLADPGSFDELFGDMMPADPLHFSDVSPYEERQAEATRKTGLNEAIICGDCMIQDLPVALGAMDFSYFGGSMGSVVGEKVARLFEHALEESMPVVLISSSGGARMQEGILSLMQLAKTTGAVKSFRSAGLLYISILSEPTFGGVTASFAMLGDIIIAEPGARIGFAGRRVIEQTIGKKLPDEFQTAEYLLKHGAIDMIVDRTKLTNRLVDLIEFHQPGHKRKRPTAS